LIELKQIVKRYKMGGEVINALDRVDLSIADHEFVAIIGPSGSGKSTLMNIVGCLDYPDEGEYLLDGEDVSGFSPRELAIIRNKKIGFIFQQFNLLGKLSAYENVELPLIYQGLSAADRKERVTEALERVGLADRMNHRPNQLSGGQQQRVAIARALSTHPSLILADEPTGNLDSKSGHDIMRMLHELHDQGNAIMLITHDNAISLEAERRMAIRDGKIALVNGNHDVTKTTEGAELEREESAS
jgi:putative ABC transport system ATP-binding protein